MLLSIRFSVVQNVRKWWEGFGKDLEDDIEANS
ncbi:uncharacterized protein METZ01_LOCUS243740 [marine metagenome]|uniref:Uncharacterized protein n=1 Tax=marine metagenome TaxID=408172 RepID=A0A382HU42_9ZZZZ